MNKVSAKQPIKLSKKDALILKWVSLVKEEDARKVNFLVKQAILAYLKTGEFITIGKVHYSDRDNSEFSNTTLYLWTQDVPIMQEWIASLKAGKFNISVTIREIIRKSIKVVGSEEKEWIPSYYEFDDYRVCLQRGSNSPLDLLSNDIKRDAGSKEPEEVHVVDKSKKEESSLDIREKNYLNQESVIKQEPPQKSDKPTSIRKETSGGMSLTGSLRKQKLN